VNAYPRFLLISRLLRVAGAHHASSACHDASGAHVRNRLTWSGDQNCQLGTPPLNRVGRRPLRALDR